MLKKIGMGVAVLLVAFLVYVGIKSPDYTISREIAIRAAPEKIFPFLNNVALGEQWGPWLEVDPKAKMVHSGPQEGVGAKTSWESEGQLGTGSATIVESILNQRVEIKLEYTKPMAMEQDSTYAITTSGTQSVVTWSVRGKNNYISRLMCTFFDMDKMVGGMFEKGLSNLKALVEKSA